jgi:hypothetical protein
MHNVYARRILIITVAGFLALSVVFAVLQSGVL